MEHITKSPVLMTLPLVAAVLGLSQWDTLQAPGTSAAGGPPETCTIPTVPAALTDATKKAREAETRDWLVSHARDRLRSGADIVMVTGSSSAPALADVRLFGALAKSVGARGVVVIPDTSTKSDYEASVSAHVDYAPRPVIEFPEPLRRTPALCAVDRAGQIVCVSPQGCERPLVTVFYELYRGKGGKDVDRR